MARAGEGNGIGSRILGEGRRLVGPSSAGCRARPDEALAAAGAGCTRGSDAVHIGTVANPDLALAQMEDGVVMGVGDALTEDLTLRAVAGLSEP